MYAKADLGPATCEAVAFFDDENELHDDVEELLTVGSWSLAQGALVALPLYFGSCGAAIAFAARGADLATVAMAGVAGGALGAALGIFPMI